MRFFTSLMACALLMAACSQQEVAVDDLDTRGVKTIGFNKVVLLEDGSTRPAEEGEFKFEIYLSKNGTETILINKNSGEPYFVTDAAGQVWVNFSDLKGNKSSLRFREIFDSEEEAEKWEELEDFTCNVTASDSGAYWDEVFFPFNEGPEVVNIPVPEEEPIEGYENQSPVTLTNAGDHHVTDNKNFFYAVLSREILEAGEVIELEMIKNGNIAVIGKAFVKLNDEGMIEIFVEEGELIAQNTKFYDGSRKNNGNNKVGLTLDYPEGEGDIWIYVWGHYYWN